MKNQKNQSLSRREFLKTSLLGLGAAWYIQQEEIPHLLQDDWRQDQLYGRVCEGKVNLYQKPTTNSTVLGQRYEDNIVQWLREVAGEAPALGLSRKWVETPDGYIFSPRLQPVNYSPNHPVEGLPESALGRGMWAEISVPYTPVFVSNPPVRSPWLMDNPHPRFYFSQIFWINDMQTLSDGNTYYHAVQKWGYGDEFWVPAQAFRPIEPDELSAIHPQAENKYIRVSSRYQTLSCFEDTREVFFCRVSTGAKFNAYGEEIDEWATPRGRHLTWRKLISHHMSGGVSGSGWDLPGIGYTILFSGGGEAIHSTFWHNDFGIPRSRGCVNVAPEDAKWIFRWSEPHIPYDVGDLTVSMPGGTAVDVFD